MSEAKIAEVHPGIYEIFLPLPMRPTIINVYLVDCHGAWTLIDTGMNTPDSIATLESAFQQLGIELKNLTTLIGTHHHVDHFGSSATIKERSGKVGNSCCKCVCSLAVPLPHCHAHGSPKGSSTRAGAVT